MKKPATADKTWEPIVTDGPLADSVREALLSIAEDLKPDTLLGSGWKPHPGLSGGCAGLALFFAYLARAHPGDESFDSACEFWLERAIDSLAEAVLSPALHGGFTGIAWTCEHLNTLAREDEAQEDDPASDNEEDFDFNEDIEAALLTLLQVSPWPDTYDLISGLAGFSVFCLERIDRPRSRECLHVIVDRLEEVSSGQDGGITWHTPPEQLVEWQREAEPNGYYNLGVAHGMPAAMGALAAAVRHDVNRAKAQTLLDGAGRWLWQQSLPPAERSTFASWISPGSDPTGTRLAWCYGDAGMAATMLAAARCQGWEDPRILQLAHDAARRPKDLAGVVDSGLCHGSGGLLQIFNRLYQSTGDDLFRQSALEWLETTLEYREPGEWVGGFWSMETNLETMKPNGRLELEQSAMPGFLTGAAGVGLALLAASSPIEPRWDRVLMLSFPMEH